MITREQIEELAQLRDSQHPVTSLFLNLDGGGDARRIGILLKDLFKTRKPHLARLAVDHQRSVEADFARIERFVHALGRDGTRALAIFSSSGSGIWEVFPLTEPVQDRLVVDTHPHIRPLAPFMSMFKRCAVILITRDHATIDLIHLGQARRLDTLRGEVASEIREAGFHGRLERRIERHADDQLHRFARAVASRALEFHTRHPFDSVVLGGSPEPAAVFEGAAHPYLRERWIGRLSLTPGAPLSRVLEEGSRVVHEDESRRASALVGRAVQAARAGGPGALGLRSTLEALSLGRLGTLVVEKGAYRPGVACARCPFLGVTGRECPLCGRDLIGVPDVIEEAVDRSLALSAEVVFVDNEERLAPSDGVAALLRY